MTALPKAPRGLPAPGVVVGSEADMGQRGRVPLSSPSMFTAGKGVKAGEAAAPSAFHAVSGVPTSHTGAHPNAT